jgi:diaminopimelate decarboxylase
VRRAAAGGEGGAMETWSRRLDLGALAAAHGTPVQIYDPGEIARRLGAYRRLVGAADRVVFPAKANPGLPILRALEKLGASVACASAQEFFLTRLAGFSPERIQLNTPAPDMQRALSLLREGGGFVADSVEALGEVEQALAGDPAHGPIFLRVNADLPLDGFAPAGLRLPGHGNDAVAKFGVPLADIVPALQETRLEVAGLHFHAGPQIAELEAFRAIVRRLHALVDDIHRATGRRIRLLNLGGGLGIPFVEGERFPSVEELVDALLGELRPGLAYLVEPGRSLVGPAAAILTRVLAVKQARGRRWAIADIGSRDLDRIAIERRPHRVLRADGTALPLDGRDVLSGSLCFADDTLLPRTSLDGVRAGDLLLIQHCGAYAYQLPRQINGRPMQGALRCDEAGRAVATAQPEEEILNPTYTTYLWENDWRPWDEARTIDPAQIDALNSDYLQFGSVNDAYEIVGTRRLSENHYVVDLDVRSEVDFISVPFCLRLACDGAIAVTLHNLGVTRKEFPVWADRVYLDGSVNIRPNRVIACDLALSPFGGKGASKVTIVRFALDGGKFSGFVRLKFRLPTPERG